MAAVRCPKCRLINNGNARRCRRCGTRLSLKNEGKTVISKRTNYSQLARHWAIPAIVIVAILCTYGFYTHSQGAQGAPKSIAEISTSRESTAMDAPEGGELGAVKKLQQDFMTLLDQNLADKGGEGFKKNQTLASETMALLNQQQGSLHDPVALAYLGDLYHLVEKYNAQLIQYNLETLHLSEVRRQTDSEIANLQNDSSLTPEQRISRKHDLNAKYFDEADRCSVNSKDLVDTTNSLRHLTGPGAS